MKFPKRIKYRGRVFATIYGKTKAYNAYRVAWSIHGKRQMKAFDRFGGKDGAHQFAEKMAKDLATGSQAPALSSAQAADALAAFAVLDRVRQTTGKRLSLAEAASEIADAYGKLGPHSIREAVAGFLRTSATIKRKDITEAVEEYIAKQEPRTIPKPGERAQISPKYHYNRAIMLRRFAATFPNTAVLDLGKEHLDAFFGGLGKSSSAKARNGSKATSAKSRNHHRAAIRQFLQWTVRNDYLSPSHRLLEADSMASEEANTAEVEFYTPKEFFALLECAEGVMRALVAIGGFAGLRTAELLRLDWSEVWRIDGYIDITKGKAKNRQRRYVTIPEALKAWLEPYRAFKLGVIWTGHEISFQRDFSALCERAGVKRKENGLRHSFCTYHYAFHADETLTAKEAGHSPAMFHAHYKEPVTREQGAAWFAVVPGKAENVIALAVGA